MNEGFKPYPTYKASGVEWLGEVPEHWDWAKIIRYASLRTGGTPDRNNSEYWVDGTINWLASGEVNKRIIWEVDGKITEAGMRNSNASMLPVNSVLIALNGQGRTKGMSALLKVPSTCNQSLAAFICNEQVILPNYLHFYLESRYRDIRGLVGEQRDGLSLGLLKQIPVYIPPLPEQHAIAAFLDHKTAEIDALIAAKERLIALLREKRAALITSAVTKGLDPDVPMKDSGVEWLGEVPEGWEVKKLKTMANIIDGDRGTEYPSIEDFVTDGIPFLSSKNIKENELAINEVHFISPEKFKALRQGKLSRGDLVITVRGTIGNVAIFDNPKYQTGFINAQMMIIRPNHKVNSRYLFHVMRGHYWNEQVHTSSYGTAQQQLSNKILSSLFILVPPLDEQITITQYIDKVAKETERLMYQIQLAVDRLQEYRTALISAAVTGKIDVRDL